MAEGVLETGMVVSGRGRAERVADQVRRGGTGSGLLHHILAQASPLYT